MNLLRLLPCAILLAGLAQATSAAAGDLPVIRSCIPIDKCIDNLGNLNEQDATLVRKLLTVVTSGASEAQISERFGNAPFSQGPRLAAWGHPPGTTTYKAAWSTIVPPQRSGGPHFDVLFINNRAVMFTWYGEVLSKRVQVQVAP